MKAISDMTPQEQNKLALMIEDIHDSLMASSVELNDKCFTAELVRNVRKDKGMTQEEFGQLFEPKATKALVSKWEHGRNVPEPSRLRKLAAMANLNPNLFLPTDRKKNLWARSVMDMLNDFREELSEGETC